MEDAFAKPAVHAREYVLESVPCMATQLSLNYDQPGILEFRRVGFRSNIQNTKLLLTLCFRHWVTQHASLTKSTQ